MSQWLSTSEAARRLGVKPETLYAYVSRGVIRSYPQPNGRGSRFERTEVEDVLARRRSNPGGAPETVIATAVTRIGEDGVRYRGVDVLDLLHEPYKRWPSCSGSPIARRSCNVASVFARAARRFDRAPAGALEASRTR
ncbi:MAG: helix-turn-helix domain-containing protein [Ilumatobacteraceae bacterium]